EQAPLPTTAARSIATTGVSGSSGLSASSGSAPPSEAQLREARKDVARLERQISRLTERERKLHEQMTDSASDFVRLGELQAAVDALTVEREQLEHQWLETAARLD